MKKLAVITAMALAAASAFAELYPSSRYFEVGVDATVQIDQNTLSAGDILVENLVIDFSKYAQSMGEDGFVMNFAFSPKAFVNLNTPLFSAGVFTDVKTSARVSTGKGLFEFLGNGNTSDTFGTTMSTQMDMFVEVGAPVKFSFGSFKLRVTPTYYVPIVYVPRTEVPLSVTMDDKHLFAAKASANLDIYSLVDIGLMFDENMAFLGPDALIESMQSPEVQDKIASSGGFTLGLGAELPLFHTLDVGAYADVPIIPGHLKYKSSVTAEFAAEMAPLLDTMSSGGSTEVTTDYSAKFNGTTASDYSVCTPLRVGLEAAWRPFGKWLTFRPKFALAARNPFGEDFDPKYSMFPEYSLSAEMRLLYILGLDFCTSYINQVYSQQFGLALNLRIAELDVKVATSGADFAKTWSLTGAQVMAGVRVGF